MKDNIASLSEAVSSFRHLIRSLPESSLSPSTGAEWGPREVLIHLAFWHAVYASTLRALLDDRVPEMPVGTFKGLNAKSVRTNVTTPSDQLLASLETAQREIEAMAPEASSRGSPSLSALAQSLRPSTQGDQPD
jgi:hypothetical protein